MRTLGPPPSPRFGQSPPVWRSAAVIAVAGALLLLGLWLSTVFAADIVTPSQHGTLANTFATATVNNAVTVTLAPGAAQRVRLYGFTAFCNVGQASASVTNAGTTLWLSDPNYITASTRITNFSPPLTGPIGGTLLVTISSCGAAQFGKVSVQADYDSP